MVLVQLVDISTYPLPNGGTLNLSMHQLKVHQLISGSKKNMNQYQLQHLLSGKNQYRYFINKGDTVNEKEILQLFYGIPINMNISGLNLSRNYVIYFPHEMIPRNIKEINLNKNLIRETGDWCNHLEKVKYNHNPIERIPMNLPENLLKLSISRTNVSELPNLPISLQELSIRNTNIRRLPENFTQLVNLRNFKMDGNPQLFISEEELAFIDVIFQRRREEEARRAAQMAAERTDRDMRERTIYQDGQNVHDTKINKDVLNGVVYLFKKVCQYCKSSFISISMREHNGCLTNEIYEIKAKLDPIPREYLEYFLYEIGDCKFAEYNLSSIFMAYFNHITTFEKDVMNEIIGILNNDLRDMRNVCITGRVARLINTLSGFDENIQIQIANSAQIQAKYSVVQKKYENENIMIRLILGCWDFYNMMLEILVEPDTIEVWLNPYWELMEDNLNGINKILNKDEDELTEDLKRIKETILNKIGEEEFSNCSNWLIEKIKENIEEEEPKTESKEEPKTESKEEVKIVS